MITVETVKALIAAWGVGAFPAIVSLILLFKLDRSIKELTQAVWELSGKEGHRRNYRGQ